MPGVGTDYIHRRLKLEEALKHKSVFLFGPRQTGKTSLLRAQLPSSRLYNLLDSQVFLDLSQLNLPGFDGESQRGQDGSGSSFDGKKRKKKVY